MTLPNSQELLNTSWTLHRLSPLHHGKEFETLLGNSVALKTYATRLRDQLTGDVLAGFQVGTAATSTADEDALSKTGALKECTWATIPDESSDDGEQQQVNIAGILVTLEYENVTYKATLLSGADGRSMDDRKRKSTYLPLLLTRLPNALRQTFVTFLSTNFDAYCSLLRLPPHFLCAGLEMYTKTFLSSNDQRSITAPKSIILEEVIKELQLTLSFSPSVAPALRSLNINVPRESFTKFVLGSSSSTPSSERETPDSPFLTHLCAYLEKHLAMKLDLDDLSGKSQNPAKQHVRLTKIACGGFVLGSEGRMKLVGKSATNDDDEKDQLVLRASGELLRAVIRRAITGERQVT